MMKDQTTFKSFKIFHFVCFNEQRLYWLWAVDVCGIHARFIVDTVIEFHSKIAAKTVIIIFKLAQK